MALGSQATTAETLTDLASLVHDTFIEGVQPNVRRESPVAMLFEELGAGMYRLEGDSMKFATDLEYATGAMATDGNLPDHVGLDAVEGAITPIRRYRRIALDNFIQMRAQGPAAYQNLTDRIFDILWDSWKSMEMRHSIGPSSALIGVVESRTDGTSFVIADGYGHTSTSALSHLSPGSIICWWDLTATAAIDGAAVVTSIDYSTRTVTVDSEATWEPGDNLGVGDLIYFATTNNISTDYFTAERNLGPNGLGTILDPDAGSTTVFSIAEGTYGRWKPFRKASTTFDHIEVTEHWQQLAQKRGFPVTPQTDVAVAFPSAVAQLARSLMAFQQQAYTGGNLQGGYAQVTVSGIGIMEDGFFYHDVFATLCREKLFRITLGDNPDFFSEDGAMWSRIPDFDGKDAYVKEYMNYLCTHRGANGALTSIATDVTDNNWTTVPDY